MHTAKVMKRGAYHSNMSNAGSHDNYDGHEAHVFSYPKEGVHEPWIYDLEKNP